MPLGLIVPLHLGKQQKPALRGHLVLSVAHPPRQGLNDAQDVALPNPVMGTKESEGCGYGFGHGLLTTYRATYEFVRDLNESPLE